MSHFISSLHAAVVPPAVLGVLRDLEAAGHKAYLVGGCVRDMCRGVAPQDFDVATSARPEAVQQTFRRTIPTGLAHGTVTVLVDKHHVEVTTFRSEGEYKDGRRPETVTFELNVEADLSRRDFTINAMAYAPASRQLIDPFGGLTDLAGKVVRCVGRAHDRFSEDGLRALRAVRFATVLDFELNPDTAAAIAETLPVFDRLARERVQVEFFKIMLSPHVERGLSLLLETGLWARIAPSGGALDSAAVGRAPVDLSLRLAVLLAATPKPVDVMKGLKASGELTSSVAHLVSCLPLPQVDASDLELRRWLARARRDAWTQVVLVARAVGHKVDEVSARLKQLEPAAVLSTKELALDGAALMSALGVGPGPLVGQASRYLLEQVLEAPERNTPGHLRECLAQWGQGGQTPSV